VSEHYRHGVGERRHGVDVEFGDQGGFGSICRGHDHVEKSRVLGRNQHREQTRHRTNTAVERELTQGVELRESRKTRH
jgi:hypothetical protein